jgi:hypothetical protein
MLPRAARPSAGMVIAWATFFTLSMVVYAVASDGDFSFLLTYAACMRSFGFFLLNLRMFASKSGSWRAYRSVLSLEESLILLVLDL